MGLSYSSNNLQKKAVQKLKELDERETGVMPCINDKRVPGLVNVARGTVTDIIKDRGVVSRIMIQFDDIDDVQCIERKEKYLHTWIICIRRCFRSSATMR